MSELYVTGPVVETPADGDIRYLYTTWAAREALAARGLPSARLWDGISIETGMALDAWVLDRAMRWYRAGDADVTDFHGISLGGIHEWMVWFSTFVPVYKFGAALHDWLERERPAQIWLDASLDPHWPAVLEAVLSSWLPGAHAQTFNGAAVTSSALQTWRPQTLRRRHHLAATAWNAIARCMRLFVPRAARTARYARTRTHVLSFNYHTIEPVLGALLDAPERFQVSLADRPSARHRWPALRSGVNLLLPDPAPLGAADVRRVRDIQTRWHALAETAEFRRQFEWAGCDLWPALYPDLARIIDDDLPRTAALARGYLDALQRAQPDCVLLPFDSAYLHQTVIEAARQLDIPSVVMLHGLPGIYHRGGCSLRSDYLLVWGDEIAKRFVQAGRPSEQIFQVGFPETLAAPTVATQPARHAPLTVLLLTNPFGNGTTLSAEDDAELYLFNILDELRQRPNLRVLLRPHPSESPLYYQRLVTERQYPRVQLAATEPIPDLLRQSDLVIGPISTVLVDALLAHVPVMCINFGKTAYPAPFDGQWSVPLITDLPTLRQQLDRLEQAAFDTSSAAILAGFCGPCDGQAIPRILDTLEQLAARRK